MRLNGIIEKNELLYLGKSKPPTPKPMQIHNTDGRQCPHRKFIVYAMGSKSY